jgi:hypothetical protein
MMVVVAGILLSKGREPEPWIYPVGRFEDEVRR